MGEHHYHWMGFTSHLPFGASQKQKMEDMATEFGEMLKEVCSPRGQRPEAHPRHRMGVWGAFGGGMAWAEWAARGSLALLTSLQTLEQMSKKIEAGSHKNDVKGLLGDVKKG
jgi:hypothetical protein